MSRIYVLSNIEKPRSRERSINKLLWIIILVLIGLILIEALFQFLVAPNLLVRKVTVKGNTGIVRDVIIRVAGLDKKEYYFSINTNICEKKIGEIPGVKAVTCEKVFPDTIAIAITERTPLALSIVEENGRSIPVVFDDDGVVFQAGRDVKNYNLPVFSGLKWAGFAPGTRLPEKIIPFLLDLKKIKESSRTVFDFVSEIKIEPADNDIFELVFYMVPYATRIRSGSSVSENMLVYALMVCDVLKKNKLDSSVKELDFRSKDIVYQDQGGT